MAEALTSRSKKCILAGIKNVCCVYAYCEFRITTVHGDGEYESMIGDFWGLKIRLNTTAKGEHVPEIERYIRTTKDRCRCVYNTVPFDRIPSRMTTVELVYASQFWLNMFPSNDRVPDTIIPRGLVTGLKLDYNKHCRITFGAYAQTYEEHDNTMATRTTGAIALRPMGNEQGGYYFLSLSTGQRLKRYQWTELPMPKEVIDRVHTLARRSKANRNLTFKWRDGTAIEDEQDADDADGNSLGFSDSDDDASDSKDNSSDESANDNDSENGDGDDDASSDDDDEPDNDDNQPINPINMPFAGVDENDEDEAEHPNGEFDEAHNNDIGGIDENDAPIISDNDNSESTMKMTTPRLQECVRKCHLQECQERPTTKPSLPTWMLDMAIALDNTHYDVKSDPINHLCARTRHNSS
jgi:hypothetical protein